MLLHVYIVESATLLYTMVFKALSRSTCKILRGWSCVIVCRRTASHFAGGSFSDKGALPEGHLHSMISFNSIFFNSQLVTQDGRNFATHSFVVCHVC